MNQVQVYDRVVAVGVDIQNDFCPGGSLPVAEGDQIVVPFNQVADWTRANRGVVAFTRDWHPAETNHFGNPPDYVDTWPAHCVAGTPGAEFKEGLDVRDGDPIFDKGTEKDEAAYSGFEGQMHDGLTLETLVRPVKHERVAVVLGGLATDYCVKATALDAARLAEELAQEERHLGVYALKDAMRAVVADNVEAVYAELEAAGVTLIDSAALVNGDVLQIGA